MANNPVNETNDKKENVGTLLIIVFALFLLYVAVMGALAYHYNLGGIRDKVITYFTVQDGIYAQKMSDLDAQLASIDARNKEIEEKNLEIEQGRKDLALAQERQKALDEEMKEREALLQEKEKLALSKQELFNKLAETVSKMTPASAANMLEQMGDINSVAAILSGMDSKKSAAILNYIDVAKAAEITAAMIKKTN